MEKKLLVIQCEYEDQAVAIKDLLKEQGVYESNYVIICSKGVIVTLNGKKLTSGEEDRMKIRYVPPEERARIGSDNPGFDLFKLIIAIMIVLFVAYAIYKS